MFWPAANSNNTEVFTNAVPTASPIIICALAKLTVAKNIDNIKDYYNSMYGNYSGSNQITHKHREKVKDLYYK